MRERKQLFLLFFLIFNTFFLFSEQNKIIISPSYEIPLFESAYDGSNTITTTGLSRAFGSYFSFSDNKYCLSTGFFYEFLTDPSINTRSFSFPFSIGPVFKIFSLPSYDIILSPIFNYTLSCTKIGAVSIYGNSFNVGLSVRDRFLFNNFFLEIGGITSTKLFTVLIIDREVGDAVWHDIQHLSIIDYISLSFCLSIGIGFYID